MTLTPLKFKPYARLLTMLGDQLIRNEQVALAELIKNAYDADASWVKVSFLGFDASYRPKTGAKIVVEDDGHGMTKEIIENHWVNPATPMKLMGKQAKRTTAGGRIIQGEKGIGRFALLKLGRDLTMITRPVGSSDENVLELKLAQYDENFINGGQAMFLDELELQFSVNAPATAILAGDIDLGGKTRKRRPHGTRIEISPPNGNWSRGKIEKVYEDLARLQSIFTARVEQPDLFPDQSPASTAQAEVRDEAETDPEFAVYFYRDEEFEPFLAEKQDQLNTLLQDKTVFKIEGGYDDVERRFTFTIDGRERTLLITDAEISGLAVFRDYLKQLAVPVANVESFLPECGPFQFSFYVFDFSNEATGKRLLDKDDKELIKKHRIYLYRDGIRVYPYGDPDDDWLLIDVRRGTVRASEFLSNDQVIGYVAISQKDNPNLRDKTSREGLVDTGRAVQDFRALLQVFLAWVRKAPYQAYKIGQKQTKDVEVFKSGKVPTLMDDVVSASAAADVPPAVREKIAEVSRQYKVERRYLVQRAENTEHLAGVGLSVEAASHDLMLAMQRSMSAVDKLASYCDGDAEIDKEALRAELMSIRGLLSFVQSQMGDMQTLFRSTKQRRKDVRVLDLVEKVAKIFKSLLERNSISVRIETMGAPLVAKTTDAVLLQLLLNLFDNAAYWLQGAPEPREIEILLDGDANQMVFADNGPGFRDDDLPYIFEPFFSGKGEEGRGLGLYIARQLLGHRLINRIHMRAAASLTAARKFAA
ncbi:ATP-binding protein, partial [Starkeya sp. 3C]